MAYIYKPNYEILEKEVCSTLLSMKNTNKWNSYIFTLSFNVSFDNNNIEEYFLNTDIFFTKINDNYYIQKFIFNNNYNIINYNIIILPQELKKTITILIYNKNILVKSVLCNIVDIKSMSYPICFYPHILIEECIWLEKNIKFIL